MIGRTYLERGALVVVLTRWGGVGYRAPNPPIKRLLEAGKPRGAPRNVLIRRADGSRVVRPFRGLRKISVAEPHGG